METVATKSVLQRAGDLVEVRRAIAAKITLELQTELQTGSRFCRFTTVISCTSDFLVIRVVPREQTSRPLLGMRGIYFGGVFIGL